MMLVEGSDAERCKLFMSTLVGTTMDWFVSLPDGHVTSFPQLTKLFRAQYIANQAPPSVSYDLFDVKQYQGESLKEFLHYFGAQVVRLNLTEEKMMVHAFRKGIVSGQRVTHSEPPQDLRRDKASCGGPYSGRGRS